MRAAVVKRTDGPMGVRIVDAPALDADDDVLVDVVTAGVAYADVLLARGMYHVRPDPPFTLGLECAGVVRSAPSHARVAPGDHVVGFGFGCLAEQVALPAEQTFALPPGLGFIEAGGFVLNYHTAHVALHRRGRLEAGETVLVHGAGGGLGSAIVQLAAAAGATVLATAGDDDKRDLATRAGAHATFDSSSEWGDAVRESTDGRGVDVVADVVGGEVTTRSLDVLAPQGRLLVLGHTSDTVPAVKTNRVQLGNTSLVGVAWAALASAVPSLTEEVAADLERGCRDGTVAPLVSEEIELDDVTGALRDLEGRQAAGKIVARLAPDPS